MNSINQLLRSVGTIRDSSGNVLGSCFAVSDRLVVTCYHVVRPFIGGTADGLLVAWPSVDYKFRAELSLSDVTHDIAILSLFEILPPAIRTFVLKDCTTFPAKFHTFGFRKPSDFEGLHAQGVILGSTRRRVATDTSDLLQLRCSQISKGMSGAPIILEDDRDLSAVGIVGNFWATEEIHDSDLAFAVPAGYVRKVLQRLDPSKLGDENHVDRAILESTDFASFFKVIACLLYLDRFVDGSWARTLWKCGGKKFTEDVGDPELIRATRIKKAISVTSWAAQSLYKALGLASLPLFNDTVSYIMRHYDERSGSFGFVHPIRSSHPLAKVEQHFEPNPRHTASALKLLLQIGLINRVVGKSSLFLLNSQRKDGSWGEQLDGEGNTLSTAFVLDALLKLQLEIDAVATVLDDQEYQRLKRDIVRQIEKGKLFLLERQLADGSWDYRFDEPSTPYRPYYTAHILCFVPQLLEQDQLAFSSTVKYCAEYFKSYGGLPEEFGGGVKLAPTAMATYGLSKTSNPEARECASMGLKYIAKSFTEWDSKPPSYNVIENTFLLMLSHVDGVVQSSWQEEAIQMIFQLDPIIKKFELSNGNFNLLEQIGMVTPSLVSLVESQVAEIYKPLSGMSSK